MAAVLAMAARICETRDGMLTVFLLSVLVLMVAVVVRSLGGGGELEQPADRTQAQEREGRE